MTQEQLLGFSYILIGAICGGSFGLPSKFVKKDTPWEVLWGPFFFFVTILIPVIVTPLVIDDLVGIYEGTGGLGNATWQVEQGETGFDEVLIEVQVPAISWVLLFGFLWGLGSMTLGMSFSFIGLSLAYALNYGAQIACGFSIPMLLFNSDEFLTPHGYVILGGVAACLIGVVVCGRAGILKERSLQKDSSVSKLEVAEESATKKPRMSIGLIIAFMSGILCACYAVASVCAGPIGEVASANNPNWAAAWAVTAVILWGGAVSSCLYCLFQLIKNGTWGNLFRPSVFLVFLLAAVMAVLHNAAIFFFGLGWINLGDLGVSVGYPVFMSFAIIVGNVHGFRTGEWKGASRQSVVWIVVGIAILIIGVCIIAQGKAMMG